MILPINFKGVIHVALEIFTFVISKSISPLIRILKGVGYQPFFGKFFEKKRIYEAKNTMQGPIYINLTSHVIYQRSVLT